MRTLLLYVNLIILMLPVTGFWMLRIYENELVRRTEGELLSQAAFIRAAYLAELERQRRADPSLPAPEDPALSHPARQDLLEALTDEDRLEHIPSTIDLNRVEVAPRAGDPRRAARAPSARELEAGEHVSRIMRQAQRVTLAGMRVVDQRGVVVASSRGGVGLSLAHRTEVARALEGEYVKLVRERHSDSPTPPLTSISRRTSLRLFVAMPVEVDGQVLGAVITSRTPVSLARALYDNRLALMVLAVTQLVAVLVLTWYTSRTIVRPVMELIEQARRLERGGRGAAPLERPVTHEVAELSEAIVQMARALHERADYIKTFASSVSHEFKTPLTSIRGTVELLEDHLEEMSAEERERFIGIIDGDAARLQKLVDRLLDLARADVYEPGDQTASPASLLEQLTARGGASGLRLELEIETDARRERARIAPVTLESILTNLIENARQHGGDDVQIMVHLRRQEGWFILEVIDDGPGISEANRARIFDPFFTTARDSGGTGLGLSVVASLLEAHGGGIELAESQPTTFRMRLPTTPDETTQEDRDET